MFRRQEDTIGKDPVYPADLKELGFFVNGLGQIRMIEAPDKEYVFHSTNDERVNELRREAMQECSRQETEKRLSALGIGRIYLPDFTTTKPDGPHVPILSPSPEILKTRKRIIVLVNDAIQDIGILAYRQMQRELGLNGASVVDFVKEIVKRSATEDAAEKYNNIFDDGHGIETDSDVPALVVLNTAQLLYSHKHNKALTMRSWSAMPRKSVAHDMIRIHDVENHVQGHRTPEEHVKWFFDNVLCNSARVASDAEVYLIAVESGTNNILNILEEEFERYSPRITAMALIESLKDDSQIKSTNVRAFLHQRAREWRHSYLSNNPKHCTALPADYLLRRQRSVSEVTKHVAWNENVPETSALPGLTSALHHLVVSVTPSKKDKDASTVAISDEDADWSSGQAPSCPTFAGGCETTAECILTNPAVQHAVLAFFEEAAQDPENYCNPDFKVHVSAPQPTPDNPLELYPDDANVVGFPPLSPEMTPEQTEVYVAQAKLAEMELALRACPVNVPELQPGRNSLLERICNQQVKLEKLEKKKLATGGLPAGAAPEQRENWKPQKEGKKVAFAGTKVDSELLKAAGLLDTADEELEKLGEGVA